MIDDDKVGKTVYESLVATMKGNEPRNSHFLFLEWGDLHATSKDLYIRAGLAVLREVSIVWPQAPKRARRW